MWLTALFRILSLIVITIGIGCIVWAEYRAPDAILKLLWFIIGAMLAMLGFLGAIFTSYKTIFEWFQLFRSHKP